MTICWEPVRVERCIPSDEKLVHRLIEDVMEGLRTANWPDNDLFAIHLALEEALVNAIEHGNDGNHAKRVWIEADIGRLLFSVRIRDEGRGFDPARVPDPTTGERLQTPHGRGVLLMRQLMTSLKFNDRGNEVTMEKRRSLRPE